VTRRALLAGAATLLLAAPAARAAAPWSPPATVAGMSGVDAAGVLFTGAGEGLALGETGFGTSFGAYGALSAPGATTFAPARRVAPRNVAFGGPLFGGFAPLGAHDVAMLGVRVTGRGATVRPWLGIGRAGQPLRQRTLFGARRRFSLVLDVTSNPRGDLAGVFLTCNRTCERQRITLVTRPVADGRVRTRQVATVGSNADDFARAAVALDTRDRLVVAYAGDSSVFVRRGRLGGPLGRPQRLARVREDHPVESMSAALTIADTAVVAWVAQRHGETVTPARFAAAIAPAGRRFAVRGLEHWPARADEDLFGSPIRVLASAGGRVTIAWTGFSRGHYVARVADVQGARVGRHHTLGLPGADALLDDLAAAPSGRAVAAVEGLKRGVFAAERPVGAAAFGPLVAVSDPLANSSDPHVAFDPVSGRAVAAWVLGVGRRATLQTATLAP
jgi:hypothetical protein